MKTKKCSMGIIKYAIKPIKARKHILEVKPSTVFVTKYKVHASQNNGTLQLYRLFIVH